jgi:5S rRNA maturation endonuclease (ribonuclease M5)
MGSTMSAAQEELIRRHTDRNSQVIVILDEDEAGKSGREDIAVRLAKFCFVKTHVFDQPDTQPDHLSAEDIAEILGGAP